ncbi:thiazole tautomerase TenI [Sediminibacillus albus]|uniref:Thiazole tautomerase (Transcriptional regulator TenI) n=1 Tax=Sediminibacillus albus TaxID=407036 RepID=A0A1G8VSE2_9BACI|nr:thiazole tautomerase TenI [Sediminibacillus albus]SDJ69001.1 thiazole tautomerase (transcriptional regulator TenI) [Sediminibacillus albus]
MYKGDLHIVSTGKQSTKRLVEIASQIHPYLDAFHIREKNCTASLLMDLISQLEQKRMPRSKIIINDRVDAAYISKVKGVQLTNHSISVKLVKNNFSPLQVGSSVHSLEEAKAAERGKADYLLFGHVFPTNSKAGLQAKGLKQLEEICKSVSIPVIAIGGVKPDNIRDVIDSGASGAAVMSGVMDAPDPLREVQAYCAKLAF